MSKLPQPGGSEVTFSIFIQLRGIPLTALTKDISLMLNDKQENCKYYLF